MKNIKLVIKSFCVCFLMVTVILPFGKTIMVYAATGYATAITNVRSGPGTSHSIVGSLSANSSIDILETVSTDDSTTLCSSGTWYKFLYNGTNAYVCTTVITNSDLYNRPWTTPKKSIIGGAVTQGSNYILKGQYTSYLIRFNVNPGSTNAVYNHQYMTDIRGALSSATSSYNTYLAGGLLSQPLVFTIPVFNNMPDYNALPSGSYDASGQTEVTDTAFEALLNAQGFPESYKKKLRILHNSYPNWVFESLQTGLDWNTAVNSEQVNSYVDDSDGNLRETAVDAAIDGISCNDTSTGYCLKSGSNWYLANTTTTAYYLDPRNFLAATKILMFEKLAYSSIYTEAVVQTRLNSTFMEGSSALDGQTYASIFVEAGQVSNINPIYLASQVIREVGVNGSMATTGEQFTYNCITYKGLYNFFNVGAVDSASSPVRAGLVWANGGATSTILSNSCDTSSDENSYLSLLGFTKTSGYITSVDLNQVVSSLSNKISGVTITVTDAAGTTIYDNTKLTTGSIITMANGTTSYTGTAVIYGDINGDGNINAIDLLHMRRYLLDKTTYSLSGANLQAAKIAKGSAVSAVDLLYLRRYLLDSNAYNITQ